MTQEANGGETLDAVVDPRYRRHTALLSPYPIEPGIKEQAVAEGVDAQTARVDLADEVLRRAGSGPRAVVWVVAPESFSRRSLGGGKPVDYDVQTGRQIQARKAVGFFDRRAQRARRLLREDSSPTPRPIGRSSRGRPASLTRCL